MASVNKVILVGNLGRDPEVRQTSGGMSVANFSVATTYKRKDAEPETEWHNCTLYGKLAEVAGKYLTKGSPVFIEGRLHTRKWQAKDGTNRQTVEIVVDSLQMLGIKGQSQGQARQAEQPQQQTNQAVVDDCPF